jgi:hypothetical protein
VRARLASDPRCVGFAVFMQDVCEFTPAMRHSARTRQRDPV